MKTLNYKLKEEQKELDKTICNNMETEYWERFRQISYEVQPLRNKMRGKNGN